MKRWRRRQWNSKSLVNQRSTKNVESKIDFFVGICSHCFSFANISFILWVIIYSNCFCQCFFHLGSKIDGFCSCCFTFANVSFILWVILWKLFSFFKVKFAWKCKSKSACLWNYLYFCSVPVLQLAYKQQMIKGKGFIAPHYCAH